MIVKARLEWDEDMKHFIAICPDLNHLSSSGKTEEEAIENLQEMIKNVLNSLPDNLFYDSKNLQEVKVIL
ncbi:MAG: type II toxin-antitoxin system HicB family antitoxin [Gloeocapsa sp. DLM2.Bin57]|nr:MAG: type II toxin-antitoxin system HicB family antitoxin [Gloeocapsa sp. DLM2.Bin57]